ncbi:cell surface protein [Methanosarcina siciliae C2J]|uniref:Cell surface protein n=1 Tax=Methanosarcina siciliae C2J TaxID=1434118 RepID=A0A0E3PNH0_9EURY|nr:PQQ-binding-like beta-propeller repeat protein [Methanosarcina siciliae]AKB37164.1 cell surface protein [Methanosarcina siciliae C2J]
MWALILSCAICLTLLAGSAAAAEVHFALVDPANGTSQWITGSGTNLSDAWDNAATNNGYTYAIGENPSYPGQLSTINGPFTNYEGWGNTGEGMTWWKTYVSDGSNLSTWNIDYSQTGVVLADHAASEFPYFAFVWGTWQTWPNPWGMGSDFTVLPSNYSPAPVANFTSDVTSGTAPLAVQFNDSSTGNVSSWQWDFNNDGTVDSTDQNPIYTYISAGTYAVNLTASNAAGSDSEVKVDYILTVEGTGTVGLADTAWPKFGRDLNNTGQSPYAGPETNKTVWTYKTGSGIRYCGPSIGSEGTIYVGSNDNKIYALNPDGTLKWNYTTGDYVYGSPAIASDGTIYVGSKDYNLYALNPDGTLKWNYTTGSYVYGSPTIGSDGTIYCGSSDKKVYALNPDGTLKWNYTTGGNIYYSTPAIGSDGTIYIGSNDKKLYALNPDGTLKWSYTAGYFIRSSAAIGSDGTIYFGSDDNKVYALNPDGTLKWSYTTGNRARGSPSIATDGTIYIGSCDNKLYALNPDGTLKWNYTTGFSIYGAPAIDANGNIYFGSLDNNVYALNPDGTLKWKCTTGGQIYGSSAIGSDGSLYIGSYNGNLYAFNATDPAPVSAPVANFTADITSGYVPLTVQFNDKSIGSPTSYAWDFDNDGTVDSTEQSPSYTYESAGTYTVNLTVTNDVGSDSEVKTDYITVSESSTPEPEPVAEFTADVTSGTAPLTVNFTDQSTESPTSWVWDFENDGVVDSTEQNPSYTYNAAGNYTVNLTVANTAGSDSEVKTDYITVSESSTPAEPVAAFTADVTGGTAPLTVNFTDQSTGTPTSWFWDFGDGANSTEQNPSYTYASAGNYTVNLTVANANGTDSEVKMDYILTVEEAGTYALADTAWPKFGRDLNNTGQSPYAGPETNNTVWTYATGGSLFSCGSSIGADGTIYIGSADRNIYALNHDGTLKWKYAVGGSNYIYGSPAIASDGTIYLGGGYDKNIYALNPDGTLKWNYKTGNYIRGSPAIGSDGTIYFGSGDKKVYALNPDGTLKWSYTTGGPIYGTPAIGSDGTIYIGSGDDNLYALNPDGTLKWSYTTGDQIRNSAAIGSDGTIYFGSLDHNLYALNPDGTLKWTYNTKDNRITTPATGSDDVYIIDYYEIYASPSIGSDGTIYIGDNGGTLHAINPDGTLKWNTRIENRDDHLYGSAPVIDANGNIYVGSYNNNVYALNPDGTLKWKYATGGCAHLPLAIGSDGTLYIGSGDGNLYAFKDIAPVPPVADFAVDITNGNAPLTVNFTDASNGTVSSWAWDFNNDGTVDSTEQNPSYTYESAGTYTVNLTVTNDVGSDSEVKTDYITVSESSTLEPEPVAEFTADVTGGTAPLTVNFTDQSTGTPTSWLWDFGDGANSTEQNPSHTYSAAGNYTVNLTVENAAGTDFELKSDYIEVSEASGSTVTLYFDPESSSVAEDESTEISVVASNFPAGLSGYNLTVALDDPAIAEIVDIEYPSWALITQNSSLPGTSIYMKTVDLEDAVKEGAADVVLATLTVSGKEKGSANLSIGVKRLEEDSGDSIEPALLAGTIEVTLLSPLPDQEYAPKDLDGDGLYEDLTGNGEFSFVDIVAYFHNMDWIEENMPVEYFDFNGNGRIDFDDVVDMFAMI